MLSLDDCSRTELKRLARYAKKRQIAEVKACAAKWVAESEDR